MVSERTPRDERTPRRRHGRIFSVLLAVAGILTLALGPAMARNDTHTSNGGAHHAAALLGTFLLRHQALEDSDETGETEVDEADPDDSEVDEDSPGEDEQGEDADENDPGEDEGADEDEDEDEGDEADEDDSDEDEADDDDLDDDEAAEADDD